MVGKATTALLVKMPQVISRVIYLAALLANGNFMRGVVEDKWEVEVARGRRGKAEDRAGQAAMVWHVAPL
jgi:hypothetical protein